MGPFLAKHWLNYDYICSHDTKKVHMIKAPTPPWHRIPVYCCIALVLAALCTTDAQSQLRRMTPRQGGFFTAPRPERPVEFADFEPYFEPYRWVSAKGDTLRYRVLLPANYDPLEAYPLLLFLHGAGERGSDNTKQLTHGAKMLLAKREDFPAIVVMPQCPADDYWSNVDIRMEKQEDGSSKRIFHFQEDGPPTRAMALLLEWLPALEKQYKVKKDQRYVMGLSMGGMGTFEIVRRMPNYFAAAVPICGGANPKTAAKIKDTAFWIFHGQKDDVVPYELSEAMVLALQGFFKRAEVIATFFPQANHNSWDPAFADPELMLWLFRQKIK
jgi:predicted peptidase